MPQEGSVAVSLRCNLSIGRSFRSVGVANRDDRGCTVLHIGAKKGYFKQVKRLLDEGIDVNVPAWGPKSKGLIALHLSSQAGHVEMVDEMLGRGANIDARTLGVCGWTPLHSARKERKKEAVKFLIENGAFVNKFI